MTAHDLTDEITFEILNSPDETTFALWRAVFALVFVDGEISDEEDAYINQIMDVFKFSAAQKAIIASDLKSSANVEKLFHAINDLTHQKQFFILARTIIWCDGLLHDDERAVMQGVKDSLGDDIVLYESEIRWLDRKPDFKYAQTNNPHEAVMKHVIEQMNIFYQDLGQE